MYIDINSQSSSTDVNCFDKSSYWPLLICEKRIGGSFMQTDET